MISKLKGKVEYIKDNGLIVNVNGLSYEVWVPLSILSTLPPEGQEVELITLHYYHMEGNKITPILVGFRNEIEREFFEQLTTVSGIGPKVAVKALKYPIPEIAVAIDRGDERFLSSLPGIGRQKARQIIAKLQGKVGKYALIREEAEFVERKPDVKEEALQILLKLQYKKKEALEMIEQAYKRRPKIQDVEELLNEIYRGRISENAGRSS
jgi:Holliday junction DNA helicase RuvA